VVLPHTFAEICTADGSQYKIFVLWTVRTQAPDGPQFKKETKTELLEFCPNTSPSTMEGPPPGIRLSTVQKLCET
jgi:hypothetical protein